MLPDLENPKQLSIAIKDARMSRRWSRAELASKLEGVSERQIEAYESFGKKNYTPVRPVVLNQLNRIFFGNIMQKTVGVKNFLLNYPDEELISELKARGVSVFRYIKGK